MSLVPLVLLAIGQLAPGASLEDQDGVSHAILDGKRAALLVYEDKDGGKQNAAAKAMIARYNDPLPHRDKLAVWPVADLTRWNWWPARGKALLAVQESAKKNNTRILIDWTKDFAKSWGLPHGKNAFVLVSADGRVIFSSEGELAPAQLDALDRAIHTIVGE